MTPYYEDDAVTIHAGDCLDVLRSLPDASVEAVVTDPPYGLEFMGKEWDAPWKHGFSATGYTDGGTRPPRPNYGSTRNPMCRTCRQHQRGSKRCVCLTPDFDERPADSNRAFQEWCEAWARECLRVLKPGGHMLAFGGTRTWHRLACAVEDAGFEVRDSLAWLHGQGFPKSMNLDKSNMPRCRCEMGELSHAAEGDSQAEHGVRPLLDADVQTPEGSAGGPGSVLLAGVSEQGSSLAGRSELRSAEDGRGEPSLEGRRDAQAPEGELLGGSVRPVPAGVPGDGAIGRLHHGAPSRDGSVGGSLPAEDGGREPQGSRPVEQSPVESGALPVERGSQAWGGWPVCERCSQPVVPAGLGTALKPAFEPIVVARKPLAGTVAANVLAHGTGALNIDACRVGVEPRCGPGQIPACQRDNTLCTAPSCAAGGSGRWPANVVLDESQAAALDEQTGVTRSRAGMPRQGANGDGWGMTATGAEYDDMGGASRFLYVAKADSSERVRVNGTAHPTVKPLTLMRWLVRLVTPPGGTVLEPFAGSGTTVEACILEGFRCIAIEREADYLPLIRQRINRRRDPVAAVKGSGEDGGLFSLLDDEGAAS